MWNNLKYREDMKCYELFDRAGHLAYFEKKDLKEIRDCINTVLREEKVCSCRGEYPEWPYHTREKCYDSKGGIAGRQPLTEGEGKVTTSNKLDWCIRCDYNHSTVFKESCKCLCECHKPQESNKEEPTKENLKKAFDKLNNLDIPMKGRKLYNPETEMYEEVEEPSKKPSMTIGCNECGNNIKI